MFAPGAAVLKCEHCGHENAIPKSIEAIEELDFRAYLAECADAEETDEVAIVKCDACAAEIEPPADATAFACPYCGTDIVRTAASRRLIKPKSLLPFKVSRDLAWASFFGWLRGLWFAPNKLKRYAQKDSSLTGMYVPYWTYDSKTTSHYTGQRGDDYWETETYTTTENGRSVTRTRQVRHTRWTSVSGTVWNAFNDILVLASRSLPRKYADQLEPWDLKNLVPYGDEYLSGFRAERYQVDLAEGFGVAKEVMDEAIRDAVRHDIGGDHQRIDSVQTKFDRITFKHILLPVWISAYRYNDRVYRFLVNARTGEVQGERPYSWIKITLFVLMLAGLIAGGVWLYTQYMR